MKNDQCGIRCRAKDLAHQCAAFLSVEIIHSVSTFQQWVLMPDKR